MLLEFWKCNVVELLRIAMSTPSIDFLDRWMIIESGQSKYVQELSYTHKMECCKPHNCSSIQHKTLPECLSPLGLKVVLDSPMHGPIQAKRL